MSNLAIIKKEALRGNVKAAMFLLERRFPEAYGRREHHQIDARVEQKVSYEDARAELEGRLDRIARPGAETEDPGEPEPGGAGAAPA